MRLLITGCAGFLGSHLVDAAIKHWRGEIVALCNYHGEWSTGNCPQHERVKIVRLDIRDTTALAAIAPDLIVNAAARISIPHSYSMAGDYWDVNATAVAKLLGALPKARFVQISTSEVFDGRNPPYFPTSEPTPATPYGASKLAAESAVRAYGQTVVRCFNLFGPRQTPRAVIPRMAIQAWRVKHGEQAKVKLYGPNSREGEPYSRAFVYAPDVADTIMSRVIDDPRPLVQLSCGTPIKIADLWTRIADIVGLDPACVEWGALPDNATAVWRLYGRSSHGYEPRVLDEETLRSTVNWYEVNRHRYSEVAYD